MLRLAAAMVLVASVLSVSTPAMAEPGFGLPWALTNQDGCGAQPANASHAYYLMTVDGTYGDDDVVLGPGHEATFCAPPALAESAFGAGAMHLGLTFREPHPSVALPAPMGAVPAEASQATMQACDNVKPTTDELLGDSFDITVGVQASSGMFSPLAPTAVQTPACLLAAQALPDLPLFWTGVLTFQTPDFILHPGDSLAVHVVRAAPALPTGFNAVLVATPVTSLSSTIQQLGGAVAPIDQTIDGTGLTPMDNPAGVGPEPLLPHAPISSGLENGAETAGVSALVTPGSAAAPPVPEIPSLGLVGIGLLGALLVLRRHP